MCLVITATPARFCSGRPFAVMEMNLFDPNRIVVSHQSSVVPTIRDAHDLFQCAVDALDPTQSYCVSAHWHGRMKPPRGFKAAYDRGEFIRKLNRAADAVAQAA